MPHGGIHVAWERDLSPDLAWAYGREGTFTVQTSQYVVGIEWEESSTVEHNRKQLGHCPTAAGRQKQNMRLLQFREHS